MMSTVVTTKRGERLAWPDATRAFGVLAVVLFHVLIWNHAEVTQGSSPLAGFWDKTDAALSRLRMPILFALSGFLASGSLLGGGLESVKRRVLSSYYLYAVWLTIYAAIFLLLARPQFPHAISGWSDLVFQFVVPDTTLWFVFALALYPIVLLVFRTCRVPVWLVLAMAVSAWMTPLLVPLPGFTAKVVQCFIFFACGVYMSDWIRLTATARWTTVLALWAVFGVVTLVGMGADGFFGEMATFVGGLSAIPAAIAALSKLSAWKPVARAASFIGTRTLSVYVLHPLLLAILSLILNSENGVVRGITASVVGDALYPLVLTAVVVAGALFIEMGLRKIPGNVLLQLPATRTSRSPESS